MIRQAATQEERMLAVLRLAGGAVVSRRVLLDALYPPDVTRPASAHVACDAVATRLRDAGHPVRAVRGAGYYLREMSGPAARPSPWAAGQAGNGRQCGSVPRAAARPHHRAAGGSATPCRQAPRAAGEERSISHG